jgi:hypothetical protein
MEKDWMSFVLNDILRQEREEEGTEMAKIYKPSTVMREWKSIPLKERNSNTARYLAKKAGMKSMAEVETAYVLQRLKKLRYKYEPERWQYQYEPQHYTPDFKVGNLYIEVKGKATMETRRKMLAVKRCNPDKHLVILFLKGNNKIRRGSKTTYIDWFRRQGFTCFDFREMDNFLKYVEKHS